MTSAKKGAPPEKSQLAKFKEAARELECDDDEQHFKKRLARIVKPKPQAEGQG